VDLHLVSFGAAVVTDGGTEGVGGGGSYPALQAEGPEHLGLANSLAGQGTGGQNAQENEQPVGFHWKLLTEFLN